MLRKEFAALKPAHVPEAPVHPRVTAARAAHEGSPLEPATGTPAAQTPTSAVTA